MEKRRRKLCAAVLDLSLLGNESALDDVADGLWCICEETSWVISAHNRNAIPDAPSPARRPLPEPDRIYIDLFAAQTGLILALTLAMAGEALDPLWVEETETVSHRPYSTGFYFGEPGQYYPDSMYAASADVVAVVESCGEDGGALLTQRNKFSVGDTLELLPPQGRPLRFIADALFDGEGEPIADTRKAMMPFRMKLPRCVPAGCVLRKRRENADNS